MEKLTGHWRRWALLGVLSAAALAALAVGCGGMMSAEGLGATPGGAQDIGLARELIEMGQVPRVDQFTVEGLYSEHDLTLAEAAPCDEPLCLGHALGLEVALDDDQRDLFVQLGLSTNVAAADFSRQPLNLGIVVDTSGSMTAYHDGVKQALHALVDVLNEDDRVALVVFEATARTIQSSTPASDLQTLHDAVDRLQTGGSTNMEAGMRLGYAEIAEHVDAEHLSRLIVFTDAMTNTGDTDAGSFNALTQAAAAIDIGFTFFGFGEYFDAEFIDSLAHLRGGNYRFVRAEDVKPIFEEELDYLVTPIAYDLRVQLEAAEGAQLLSVYGIPQAAEHFDGELFDVSTLFLSKRKGAIVLRFEGAELEALYQGARLGVGQASISYQTVDGEDKRATLDLSAALAALPGEGEVHYPDAAMQRTLAVTDMYLAMYAVCADYHGGGFDLEDAGARLDAAIAKLRAADELLEDDRLRREIALLEQLKLNLGLAPTE